MKTYLVPFDYSETAENALMYALEMAQQDKARLTLLHVFHLPYPTANDSFIPLTSFAELEKDAKDGLKKYRTKLIHKTKTTVEIDCAVAPDFVTDGISKYLNHHRVDLIVMGITGGSKLKEALIGSNTLNVVRSCKKNVLIIPPDAKYRAIKKIGLATNFEFEHETHVKHDLKHYADLFDAKIIAIHVNTATEINSPAKHAAIERFHKHFGEDEFVLKEIESNDVAEEVENYVTEKKCDWIAVIPKRHNIIEKLFNQSITKRLAFHSHVPVLALHDEEYKD